MSAARQILERATSDDLCAMSHAAVAEIVATLGDRDREYREAVRARAQAVLDVVREERDRRQRIEVSFAQALAELPTADA